MFESKNMSQEAVICGPHGRLICGSHRQTAPAVNILPNSLCSWWCSVGRGNSRVPHCSLIGPHGVWFCQQDMGVVALRGLGICTHWVTQEASHNVTILSGGQVSFPMHVIDASHQYPSSQILLLGFFVLLYMLLEIVEGALFFGHLGMTHTRKQSLGLCGLSRRHAVNHHSTMLKHGTLLGQQSQSCPC